MTVLVTGGAGFIGAHFVQAACDAGEDVVVLDDLSAGRREVLPAHVPVIVADVAHREVVAETVRSYGLEAVVHFAGRIQVGESVRDPGLYWSSNVASAIDFLEAVRERGVRRFVFSSFAAVYGNPPPGAVGEDAPCRPVNPYGSTKKAFEHVLRDCGAAYGLCWTALRYFNAAGAHPSGAIPERHEPETHIIPLALDAALGRRPALTLFGSDYPTADGTCMRDYIHVCDLADAHLAALRLLRDGASLGPMDLGSGVGHSVRQVLDGVASVTGRPVPVVVGERREGDPSVLVADPSLANRTLRWRASRSDLPTILADAARARVRP